MRSEIIEKYTTRALRNPKYSLLKYDNFINYVAKFNKIRKTLAQIPKPIADIKVLEIGCGDGQILRICLELGILAENIYGFDLLSDRAEYARNSMPRANIYCHEFSASKLSKTDFDLILIFTVYSSINSEIDRLGLSKEARSVLAENGVLLIYDFKFNNPFNKDVRRVSKSALSGYFSGMKLDYTSTTILPPISRSLCKYFPWALPIINNKLFHSHFFAKIYD